MRHEADRRFRRCGSPRSLGCAGSTQPNDAEMRAKALAGDEGVVQGARPGEARPPRPGRDAGAVQPSTATRRRRRTSRRRSRRSNLATIKWPADGKYLGDWKRGERIAQDGTRHAVVRRSEGTPVGANCYACHQLAPGRRSAYGTIGPSLYKFGKMRGYNDEMQQVRVRQGVQRARRTRACSNMPRFGHRRHPHRSADQGRRRAADGPGVAGQQVERPLRRPVPPNFSMRDANSCSARGRCRGRVSARRARAGPRRRAPRSTTRCAPFGNVSLLHFTDCHAQLLPVHFREPSVNLGVGAARGQAAASRRRGAAQALRHRAGHARRARVHVPRFRSAPRARTARSGGFAHLATLVKQLRATRPGALLLDGGDTLAGLGDGAVDAGPGHDRRAASCSASTS